MPVRTPVVLVAALAVAWTAAPVWASEAIGVIIVATRDADASVADNLTEVAMARIAETPGRTLLGTAELRRRLGAQSGRDLTSCLERQACLFRAAVSLGVNRLVTGAIRAEPGRFFLNLNLTDVTPGRQRAPFLRQVGSLADLDPGGAAGCRPLAGCPTRPGTAAGQLPAGRGTGDDRRSGAGDDAARLGTAGAGPPPGARRGRAPLRLEVGD